MSHATLVFFAPVADADTVLDAVGQVQRVAERRCEVPAWYVVGR